MAEARRFPWAELTAATTALFRLRGVPDGDARIVADHLVRAEARGIHSHGLLRLGFYLPKLDAGSMEPVTTLRTVRETAVFALLSGGNGVGQVIARRAMERAVERAAAHGLGAVLVRDSNHFGVAQLFTLQAVERGMIGIALSNASPAMAPTGGADKLLGTNPWSVAAPQAGGFPIAVDMANTVVARGWILAAREEGRTIPEGWALDGEGRPTTDAAAALAGVVLPMAGHKGYAIALVVDLLTGVLSGGGWLDDVTYPGRPDAVGNPSQLFVALDPERLVGPGYAERVTDAVRRIKAARRAEGVDEVLLPGEREARREAEARAAGVPLSPEILAVLERFADAGRVPLPWRS